MFIIIFYYSFQPLAAPDATFHVSLATLDGSSVAEPELEDESMVRFHILRYCKKIQTLNQNFFFHVLSYLYN